jgi:phospholipase C
MTWTKSYTAAHSQKPGAHQATNNNIFKLIDGTAGLSWKVYAQSYPGTSTCSLGLKNGTGGNHYAVRHNPAAYFDSETNSGSPGVSDKFCTNVKDLGTTSSGNLASDLSGGTLPNLSFVIPDTCNDMHDKCTQASTCSAQGAGTPTDNGIWNGDNFLCKWVPTILSSTQFANHGMLVIAWDEGEKTSSGTRTDGPLPFFVIGKNTNVNATTSSTRFDHSSTVRTIEQLLGLSGSGTLSLTGTNNVAKACNWHTFIVQTMASC